MSLQRMEDSILDILKYDDDKPTVKIKWYHKAIFWIVLFAFTVLLKRSSFGSSYKDPKKYKRVVKVNWLGFESYEYHQRD